jgi:hypothetical protein
MKWRVPSTTGWTVLHGLLRMVASMLLNKYETVCSHAVNLKIGGGPGTFFTSCIYRGHVLELKTFCNGWLSSYCE